MQKQNLVVALVGQDQPGLVDTLFKLAEKSQCSIDSCRSFSDHDSCVIVIFLSGNWGGIAKFEAGIPKIKSKYGLSLTLSRSEGYKRKQVIPYYAQVTIPRRDVSALSRIIEYLSALGSIYDLRVESYKHARSKVATQSAVIYIELPANTVIATAREEFIELCEGLNVDGMLEPDKP